MNKIINQFKDFINNLNSPIIRVVKCDIKYGNNGITDNIENLNLPQKVKDFYSSIDYMNCHWVLNVENQEFNYLDKEIDIVSGEILIPKISFLHEINNSINTYLNPNDFLVTKKKINLSDFLPFDYISSELAVCYKKKTHKIDSDNLFLFDFGDTSTITNMHIGIEEYLSIGFKYHFHSNWQKAIFLSDQKRKKLIDFYCSQLFKDLNNIRF